MAENIRKRKTAPEKASMDQGFIPPHDEFAERAVIGSALSNVAALTVLVSELKPEHFYLPQHYHVVSAIHALVSVGKNVDIVTVCAELRARNELDVVGGVAYVNELSNSLVTAVHCMDHAHIIRQMWQKRQLYQLGYYTATTAVRNDADPKELIETLQKKFIEIGRQQERTKAVKAIDALPALLQEIEMRRTRQGLVGVPSGYVEVDILTGGFRSGRFYIIAGRPSMGKTTIVLNMCWRAAALYGKRILFISLEMGKDELIQKCMSMVTGITGHQIDAGLLSNGDLERVKKYGKRSAPDTLYIDDSSTITPLELRAKVFDMKMNGGCDLVVVDYLQLMSGGGKFQDTNTEVGYISRNMKLIAKDMDVPVIALSQLSREVEKRTGARPKPSDLRDSGSLEQDADMIAFVYRPSVYNMKDQDGRPIDDKVAEFIIAKHRGGALADIAMMCILSASRFYGRRNIGEQHFESEEIYTGIKTFTDEAF